MNLNLKQLSLAAAVSAGTLGMVGAAHADVANNGIGELALVPYYTVKDSWVTGVHITNTSGLTQVVKFRLRRGSDSADALDFNIIMSPYDQWVGFVNDDNGQIFVAGDDASCTAPARIDGRWNMPPDNADGADEGYIEIIGMGSADSAQPISKAAVHKAGVPVNCAAVRDNFFQNEALDAGVRGVIAPDTTVQRVYDSTTGAPIPGSVVTNTYGAVNADPNGGMLKVSWFIRDAEAGTEFGNDAVHLQGHALSPSMSNQQQGLANGDISGFDYPDLNCTSFPAGPGTCGNYETVRADLGVTEVNNDWSYNEANGVSTDWVITIPGQYLMIDYHQLITDPNDPNNPWDFRDLPVTAKIKVWDREEGQPSDPEDELVISPSRDPAPGTTKFPYEVNVIEWGPASVAPVLGSSLTTRIDTSAWAQPYGWASIGVSSKTLPAQAICEAPAPTVSGIRFNPLTDTWTCTASTSNAPMVGFAAWNRTFADPDKNYGRAIEHAWTRPAP